MKNKTIFYTVPYLIYIATRLSDICELTSVDNIFFYAFIQAFKGSDVREYAAKFKQARRSKKVSTTLKFAVV